MPVKPSNASVDMVDNPPHTPMPAPRLTSSRLRGRIQSACARYALNPAYTKQASRFAVSVPKWNPAAVAGIASPSRYRTHVPIAPPMNTTTYSCGSASGERFAICLSSLSPCFSLLSATSGNPPPLLFSGSFSRPVMRDRSRDAPAPRLRSGWVWLGLPRNAVQTSRSANGRR